MYVLNVSYAQSPAAVEPHIPSHGVWVRKYLEAGVILAAGPKRSGLGGALLVRSIPRAELNQMIAEDSYVQAGVAEYQVIDFDCKATVDALHLLKGL